MADKRLIAFIKEARKRGYSDSEIRAPLIEKGWSIDLIGEAFNSLPDNKIKTPKSSKRVPITIALDQRVYAIIQKRARKNLMTTEEQIEDIVRRSSVFSRTGQLGSEKLDDLLVSIFSRKRTSKKR